MLVLPVCIEVTVLLLPFTDECVGCDPTSFAEPTCVMVMVLVLPTCSMNTALSACALLAASSVPAVTKIAVRSTYLICFSFLV